MLSSCVTSDKSLNLSETLIFRFLRSISGCSKVMHLKHQAHSRCSMNVPRQCGSPNKAYRTEDVLVTRTSLPVCCFHPRKKRNSTSKSRGPGFKSYFRSVTLSKLVNLSGPFFFYQLSGNGIAYLLGRHKDEHVHCPQHSVLRVAQPLISHRKDLPDLPQGVLLETELEAQPPWLSLAHDSVSPTSSSS